MHTIITNEMFFCIRAVEVIQISYTKYTPFASISSPTLTIASSVAFSSIGLGYSSRFIDNEEHMTFQCILQLLQCQEIPHGSKKLIDMASFVESWLFDDSQLNNSLGHAMRVQRKKCEKQPLQQCAFMICLEYRFHGWWVEMTTQRSFLINKENLEILIQWEDSKKK